MNGWRLTPKGLAMAGVTGKRHVLSPSMHTAVTVFENERGCIRHSPNLGDSEISPREAVVRLAVHYPALFGGWRP